MLRKAFLSCVALSVCMSLALIGGASPQPPANLTAADIVDRKSTRLNSSHLVISYAVFCLKKKKNKKEDARVFAQFSISLNISGSEARVTFCPSVCSRFGCITDSALIRVIMQIVPPGAETKY